MPVAPLTTHARCWLIVTQTITTRSPRWTVYTAVCGGPGYIAFFYDNIDGYSDGPLMTGFQLPGDNDNPQLPWAGADNTNQFFTLPRNCLTQRNRYSFGTDLLYATTNSFGGTTNSTYDRYTFYRMLDELGSDSAPESGKINLNYSNAVVQLCRQP